VAEGAIVSRSVINILLIVILVIVVVWLASTLL
jgi:hypothetical protein